MDLKTIILLFALICALAAVFVLWAKWEEEKLKTREERENYLAALNLHNAVAEALEQSRTWERLHYESLCSYAKGIDQQNELIWKLRRKQEELQDRLSAILCPHNDHVWELSDALRCEVRCKKCGRVKDAAD